jgi:hypothetical protein
LGKGPVFGHYFCHFITKEEGQKRGKTNLTFSKNKYQKDTWVKGAKLNFKPFRARLSSKFDKSANMAFEKFLLSNRYKKSHNFILIQRI